MYINNIKPKLFNALPLSIQWLVNNIRFIPDYISFRFNAYGSQQFNNVFSQFKDKYKGHRCFVIGNGPSLKKMDLSFLKYEYTFGLNRIYLLFDDLGFTTDFLISINRLVIEQFHKEMTNIDTYKLFNWKYRKSIKVDDKTAYSVSRPGSMRGDLSKGFYGFHGTVSNTAIELAYYMGFDEVILIGIDHNWRFKGEPDKEIRSENQDQDHFHPDYFGKSVKWQLPNYRRLEYGYEASREYFDSKNKKIVDATIDGKLNVFPKVELISYLSRNKLKNKNSC